MQPKPFYTMPELSKRNTERIIAIYNRVFNTNAWEEFFNPYEHRFEMILAIYQDSQAAQMLIANPPVKGAVKRFRAFVVHFTAEGIIVTWAAIYNSTRAPGRKVTDDQIRLMRKLRGEGETLEFISQFVGIQPSTVSAICRGKRFADVV